MPTRMSNISDYDKRLNLYYSKVNDLKGIDKNFCMGILYGFNYLFKLNKMELFSDDVLGPFKVLKLKLR